MALGLPCACLWVDSSEFHTFSMSKKLSNNNMNVCVAAEPGILQNVMTPVLLQTFKWYSGFRVSGLDCLLHTSITHDVIIKLELPRLTCYWSSPELCGFNTDHVSDCSVQWTIGTRNPKTTVTMNNQLLTVKLHYFIYKHTIKLCNCTTPTQKVTELYLTITIKITYYWNNVNMVVCILTSIQVKHGVPS